MLKDSISSSVTPTVAAKHLLGLIYKESRRDSWIHFMNSYGEDFCGRVQKELKATKNKKGELILAEIGDNFGLVSPIRTKRG